MLPPRRSFPWSLPLSSRSWVFLAKFAVVFGVLIAPWPGVGRRFSAAYNQSADFLFHGLLSSNDYRVRLVSAPAGITEGDWDCVVAVKRARTGAPVDAAALDLHRVLYLPIAVYLALSLASPLRGRPRRLVLLFAGFWVFPLLSLLPVLSFLAQIKVLDWGNAIHSLIDIAYRALLTPPGMAYAIPALLWVTILSLTRPQAPTPMPATERSSASA